MAIVVTCACGRQLRARDEMAGRRGKCPGCGNVLVLPRPQATASADIETAPPAAPPVRASAPAAAAVESHIAMATAPATPKQPASLPLEGDGDDGDIPLAPEPKPAPRVVTPRPAPVAPSPQPIAAKPAARVATAAPASTAAIQAKAAPAPQPAAASVPPLAFAPKTPRGEYLYWALLIALVPLIISMLHEPDHAGQRFEQTVARAPAAVQEGVKEIKEAFEIEGTMPDGLVPAFPRTFFRALPDDRIEGALLARESWMHWGLAILAAGAFYALVVYMFPLGSVPRSRMLLVGLFTGTAGILLLLGFQAVADWTQGVWVRGRGIIVLLFYIVKFIGFSYEAALDPENGFLLSFIGFTFGVGLCEELCKVVPLVMHFNSETGSSWRGACMWALASGVGFGVAEGIMYSGRYYNGIDGGEIYLVRFISCVALHATWAASAGLSLHNRRASMAEADHWFSVVATIAAIILMPVVLHGLYDTLLKRGMDLGAAAAAVASFAWLAWQVESQRRREEQMVAQVAAAV